MKVDGGKSQTLRGQCDWYGWLYMNRKFEQEGNKSYLNYKLYNQDDIQRPDDLEDLIEDLQTSKWANKSEDAHLKPEAMYSNQEENVQHLEHAAE